MMQHIESEIQKPEFINSKLISENKVYIVRLSDNYSYIDPVDGSQASKQVLYYNSIHFILYNNIIYNIYDILR